MQNFNRKLFYLQFFEFKLHFENSEILNLCWVH